MNDTIKELDNAIENLKNLQKHLHKPKKKPEAALNALENLSKGYEAMDGLARSLFHLLVAHAPGLKEQINNHIEVFNTYTDGQPLNKIP